MLAAVMIFSNIPAFAAQMPESITAHGELPGSITIDGREFMLDRTAGGGRNTATPDKNMNMTQSSYRVTGSDVALYIDYSHGHGGDHFAAGWVEATAPRFTARAEVWANGRVVVTGTNNLNRGNRAEAASYLAVGIVNNAVPRIFYNW